jgi:ferredoxin
VITIILERCDGCGMCMPFCPDRAIYLVDGGAAVDSTLCWECEACIAACPKDAIVITEQVEEPTLASARVPAIRPEPEVIRVGPEATPVLRRARLLPMVGTALIWTAREIVPRLARHCLESLDRRGTDKRLVGNTQFAPHNGSLVRGRGSGGGRRRRRRRGK